jgi:hypothetical protein
LSSLVYVICSKIGINLDFGTAPVHFYFGHYRRMSFD